MTIALLSTTQIAANIGNSIRGLRLEQGVSQDELVKRSGVSLATLRRLESGTGNTSLTSLIDVLRALGRLDAVIAALAPAPVSPIALADAAGKGGDSVVVTKKRLRAPRGRPASAGGVRGLWKK